MWAFRCPDRAPHLQNNRGDKDVEVHLKDYSGTWVKMIIRDQIDWIQSNIEWECYSLQRNPIGTLFKTVH